MRSGQYGKGEISESLRRFFSFLKKISVFDVFNNWRMITDQVPPLRSERHWGCGCCNAVGRNGGGALFTDKHIKKWRKPTDDTGQFPPLKVTPCGQNDTEVEDDVLWLDRRELLVAGNKCSTCSCEHQSCWKNKICFHSQLFLMD